MRGTGRHFSIQFLKPSLVTLRLSRRRRRAATSRSTFARPGDKDFKSLKDPSMPSPYPARARPHRPVTRTHSEVLHITINLCLLSTTRTPSTTILCHTPHLGWKTTVRNVPIYGREDAFHVIRSLTHTLLERISRSTTNPDVQSDTKREIPPEDSIPDALRSDGGHFPGNPFRPKSER